MKIHQYNEMMRWLTRPKEDPSIKQLAASVQPKPGWQYAPWQDYPEDDDVNLVSQPSIDESNATWWNNMYYDYKKSGGELNFQQFKNMLLKEGDIGDLGAKKRLDGIRKILIA